MPPNTKAHNIIVGKTWIDTYGNFVLINVATGAKAVMYFKPCGWFGADRYSVRFSLGLALRRDLNFVGTLRETVSCCWIRRYLGSC